MPLCGYPLFKIRNFWSARYSGSCFVFPSLYPNPLFTVYYSFFAVLVPSGLQEQPWQAISFPMKEGCHLVFLALIYLTDSGLHLMISYGVANKLCER